MLRDQHQYVLNSVIATSTKLTIRHIVLFCILLVLRDGHVAFKNSLVFMEIMVNLLMFFHNEDHFHSCHREFTQEYSIFIFTVEHITTLKTVCRRDRWKIRKEFICTGLSPQKPSVGRCVAVRIVGTMILIHTQANQKHG